MEDESDNPTKTIECVLQRQTEHEFVVLLHTRFEVDLIDYL